MDLALLLSDLISPTPMDGRWPADVPYPYCGVPENLVLPAFELPAGTPLAPRPTVRPGTIVIDRGRSYQSVTFTADIVRFAPTGTETIVASGLPSDQTGPARSFRSGVADIAFIGHRLYALLAGAGCSHGHIDVENAIIRVNNDGTTTQVADLSAFIKANPVANPDPADFEPDGTWYAMSIIMLSSRPVDDLSRLARDNHLMLSIIAELSFEGIRVISVADGLDSDDEEWRRQGQARILQAARKSTGALPHPPARGQHGLRLLRRHDRPGQRQERRLLRLPRSHEGRVWNKTLVRRALAEKVILQAVREQISDPEHIAYVLTRVEQEIAKLRSDLPDTLKLREAVLTAEQRRLANFVDFVGGARGS